MEKIPFIALRVDPEVDADGVSAAYLAAHHDTLPATIAMFPPTSNPGDILFCMIDGQEIASMTRELSDDDKGKPIAICYPGAELRKLAEGRYDFTYRVERVNGDVVGVSGAKLILVSLFPALDLVPPSVRDTAQGVLNPIHGLSGAVVNVAYSGMQAGQRVQVRWVGASDEGSIETPWQSVPQHVPQFLMFDIAPFLIAASIGTNITVDYVVDRQGNATVSKPLDLPISMFDLDDMRAPQLPELGGGDRIEPDKLPDGLTVELDAWYLAFERQKLWLWCMGERSDAPGQPYEHYLKTAHAISADEAIHGVRAKVPASWLMPLRHGSRLIIQYVVAFHDGVQQQARRASFEVINR
ncbi:hypothetical protein [Pandoraea anhela]|uniref:Uncharacterized protein n=1 Tax=Pandoraea anhela TaxID=2508295 RepID=A0A5E4TWQ1_9BURK|nr:hypothetical protein [Pandoraea anhela]VVD91168.1 hypothetical protein PAN31108_01626 [Pandoraea anhela]